MATTIQLRDKLLFTALTIIMAGVGWLIVQNNYRLNAHDQKLDDLTESVNNLRNISSNLIEAYNGKVEKDKLQDSMIERQREEILELWKCSKRGSTTLTLKK